MIHYRVYKLRSCGRIRSGHDVLCASDEEACRQAVNLVMNDAQVEIWQGTRYLGRVTATAAAAPDKVAPRVLPAARD